MYFYEGDTVVDYQKNKFEVGPLMYSICSQLHIVNLVYPCFMQTITACTLYKPVFVVGITVILLFVITVWYSFFLLYKFAI